MFIGIPVQYISMKPFKLHIGLTRSNQTPVPGTSVFKDVRGGPPALLQWLEDQLALKESPPDRLDRVIQYLQLLKKCSDPSFQNSFSVDAWSTARYLLNRRDDLMLCGWDGNRKESYPEVVNDLAEAESDGTVPPGIPDRLIAVKRALDSGQTLPDHTCFLQEPIEQWPALWQDVLNAMNTEVQPAPEPMTEPGTSLYRIQNGLASKETPDGIRTDQTFGLLDVHSRQRACRAISAILTGPSRINPNNTVIVCSDQQLAALLERTLKAAGLPGTGTAKIQEHQPALQVLPLILEMLWEPVDPQTVLDFLTLPVVPFPDWVCDRLTEALSDMPGLKSEAWQDAWNQCIDQAQNPDDMEEKLEKWFSFPQTEAGAPVPFEHVAERCNRVSQWAKARAETLDPSENEQFRTSLETTASMASTFKRLAARKGDTLTKPQMDRILEDLQDTVAGTRQFEPMGEGPIVIESLTDIPDACEHLIWLDTTEEEPFETDWTSTQRRTLQNQGLDLKYVDRRRDAARNQERRGFLQVTDSCTVVKLSQNLEQPDHPLWLHLKNMMDEDVLNQNHFTLDSYLNDPSPPSPFRLKSRTVPFESPQPERPIWNLANEHLYEPKESSATELKERLGCPIRWVFKRVAKLRPSSASTLPRIFRLKGTFSHQLFEHVFDTGVEPPDPEEAARQMKRNLEERVDREAAPLSLPGRYDDLQELKEELVNAAGRFARILNRGGYRVKEIETPLDTELIRKNIHGYIDCVVQNKDGTEGIIDFKYAGKTKYRKRLEEGRAVQLAVYCEARKNQNSSETSIRGTGYFILRESLLYTPEGQKLQGTEDPEIIEKAEDIFETWNRFATALERGSSWLRESEPVPARPLQNRNEWPENADMVIDTSSRKSRSDLAPCQYCDYKILCGLRTCE